MIMHWCSLKTDCTITFFIPKWYENTPFHNLNVTHASTKNHQVTRNFMENQGKTLINAKKMRVDDHASVCIKNNCTIEFSIPKLYKKTPFDNLNVTHAGTRNHQISITFMENKGNILNNTENMKLDEHALVLIKNRLHH